MTLSRSPVTWLRTLAGLATLVGALVLSGCGGGSGAPNNAFKPFLLLNTAGGAAFDVYPGFPTTMVVSGGLAPFRAVSSNPAVLPVVEQNQNSPIVLAANDVSSDTTLQVTVQDSMGRVAVATVIVHPAPLLNTLTITPNLADCGTNAICSGQTGTATVTVLGPGGGPIAGRQVRFDVYQGPFGIVSPAAGSPIVNSLTVTSDAAGHAIAILRANTDAPTQFAQLRATDLTSGQVLTGVFLIQQVTDGSTILTIVPKEATITAAFKGECSFGFTIDYFVYGGTPPYRVSSTFPNAVTLVNSIVQASGQAFRVITNGSCVDPLTFTVVDASGRQATATLVNKEGTAEQPTAPPAALSATLSKPPSGSCVGNTYAVLVSGGTAPYSTSVSPSGPILTPSAPTAAGYVSISNLLDGNTYNFAIGDSSDPPQLATFKITCPVP